MSTASLLAAALVRESKTGEPMRPDVQALTLQYALPPMEIGQEVWGWSADGRGVVIRDQDAGWLWGRTAADVSLHHR